MELIDIRFVNIDISSDCTRPTLDEVHTNSQNGNRRAQPIAAQKAVRRVPPRRACHAPTWVFGVIPRQTKGARHDIWDWKARKRRGVFPANYRKHIIAEKNWKQNLAVAANLWFQSHETVIIPISLQSAGLIKLQYRVVRTLEIGELKEELFDNLDA
jgi:hypothetical protein